MNVISLVFLLCLSAFLLGVYNAVYYFVVRIICNVKKKKSSVQILIEYVVILCLIIFVLYFRLIFPVKEPLYTYEEAKAWNEHMRWSGGRAGLVDIQGATNGPFRYKSSARLIGEKASLTVRTEKETAIWQTPDGTLGEFICNSFANMSGEILFIVREVPTSTNQEELGTDFVK